MGMGESAASSFGIVGAAHPTPSPARVKDIDAGREKQRETVASMGKCNGRDVKKERGTDREMKTDKEIMEGRRGK
jgi:hypothetical protein